MSLAQGFDVPFAGVSNWINLLDTPSTYAGQSGKMPAVKSTEDGLEFVAPGTGATFLALSDTPSPYVTLKIPSVNAGATALVYAGPTITADGGIGMISAFALGTTPVESKGLTLRNSTAAAAGAQQISPPRTGSGQGWKTDATAESQEVAFRDYVLPVQGMAMPSGAWTLQSKVGAGSYNTRFSVDTSGNAIVPGKLSAGVAGILLTEATGADVLWATLGGGSIGISATDSAPANVYAQTSMIAGSIVQAGATLRAQGGINRLGLETETQIAGTSYGLAQITTNAPIGILNTALTDAADAVAVFSCYVPGAASITNAATLRIHSMGWTSSTGPTYNELFGFFADGRQEIFAAATFATAASAQLQVRAPDATAGIPVQTVAIRLQSSGWDTDAGPAAPVNTSVYLASTSSTGTGPFATYQVRFGGADSTGQTLWSVNAAGVATLHHATSADFKLTVDGAGDCGGVAGNRFDNGYFKTNVEVGSDLVAGGDLNVTGEINDYGGIEVSGNAVATTMGAQNTPVQIITFDTVQPERNCTGDASTTFDITIGRAGVYRVEAGASFSGGANKTYQFAIFRAGGTVQLTPWRTRKLGTGGDAGSIQCKGRVILSASDEIEFWVQCTDASTADIMADSSELMVTRHGA